MSHLGFVFKLLNLVVRKDGRDKTFCIIISCDKSSTESTHDTCYIRSCSSSAGNKLEGTQNGVIVEGSALNDYLFTELFRICKLDNLEKSVLDNRISKTGRDVLNRGTFLLGLLNLGIHKYSTSRTKIDRRWCEKCDLCKVLNLIIKRFCESLYE